MICTLKECGEPSSLHLCEEHRLELADLLDGLDFLIVNLDPNIQAGKVTKKPGGQEGGNGTNAAGPRAPTTDTNQIRYWLWELPRNAYTEARDNEHAGRTLAMARTWVGKAREAVYGPEEEQVDHEANKAKVIEARGEPVPPREAINYVREKTRTHVKMTDFKNWVKHGHLSYVLDRVTTNDKPPKIYYPGDVFNVAQRMRERRQKVW